LNLKPALPRRKAQNRVKPALGFLRILPIWVAGMPQLAENCVQGLYGRRVPRDMPNASSFGDFCYLVHNLGREISAVSCREMQGKE